MSEMVERVAAAIDPEAWGDAAEQDCNYPAARERLKTRRSTSLCMARAAIEAMREPTEAMLAAGQTARLYTENTGDQSIPIGTARTAWRTMIDAALGETGS